MRVVEIDRKIYGECSYCKEKTKPFNSRRELEQFVIENGYIHQNFFSLEDEIICKKCNSSSERLYVENGIVKLKAFQGEKY